MFLDIRGCLVSIDAMDCQTEIASKIVYKGGDYLLAVKEDNQETLLRPWWRRPEQGSYQVTIERLR